MPSSTSNRAVRTIRLSDEQLAQLLEHLDQLAASSVVVKEKRQCERYAYRVATCSIKLQQPGSGSAVRYVVPTRNISRSGMAFLHGGYVHIGTICEAQLINNHGGWQDVVGRVVRCRLIEGYIHEVAIAFKHPIDPGDYASRARTCRVLLVDDDELSVRLATHHLGRLGADIVRANDGREAVQLANETEFDLILMDIEMPNMNGLEATRALRSSNYSGMIVAISARCEESDEEASLAAGCDRHLAKPVHPDRLGDVINSLRREPLTSTLREDIEMQPLIKQFLSEIPREIEAIVTALGAENEYQSLLSVVRQLRGAAGGYGYDVITDAARDVEQAINKKATRADIRTKVRNLIDWCRLAR